MQVIKISEVPAKAADFPLFTGGPVTLQRLVTRSMGKDFNVLMVNFSKGSRNKFHSHTSDQVLIVTAGRGIVASESEQRTLEPGDVAFIPGGERHWHGATGESALSHIAIELRESQVKQLEE